MRRAFLPSFLAFLIASLALVNSGAPAESRAAAQEPRSDFEMTAGYIEACSCTMFCPCYFNFQATAHGDKHFCEFNNVLRVEKGYYRDVNLAGVKVWLSGDLGPDWDKGKADWLVITFDPSVTPEQQAAMKDILLQLYPFEWRILGVDTVPILWETKSDIAMARLGNGKGEVILERFAANNLDPKQEVVIRNLKYFAAQSNTGFRMWKNKRHYYEGHDQKMDYSGTNGFRITIIFSGKAKAAPAG